MLIIIVPLIITSDISGDSREECFMLQQLSVIIQRFSAAFCDTFAGQDDSDL